MSVRGSCQHASASQRFMSTRLYMLEVHVNMPLHVRGSCQHASACQPCLCVSEVHVNMPLRVHKSPVCFRLAVWVFCLCLIPTDTCLGHSEDICYLWGPWTRRSTTPPLSLLQRYKILVTLGFLPPALLDVLMDDLTCSGDFCLNSNSSHRSCMAGRRLSLGSSLVAVNTVLFFKTINQV